MAQGAPKLLAAVLTLLFVGGGACWGWTGLKSPPVGAPASIITTPAGWARLDAGHFTFFAPAGTLVRQSPDGSGDILGPNIYIRFRLGTYTGAQEPLKSNPDYSERPIVIDGHNGFLRRASLDAAQQQALFGGYGRLYFLGLFIPKAAAGSDLEMYGTTASGDEVDMIELVYKSVRFVKAD
jgi:hypothetical protein